ncbi:MAG TPA: response regulator [Planctomycetota bacterium]|nr:response regulator [Planctomycetota bacterium]
MSATDLLARFRSLAEERLRRLNQGLLDIEQGAGAPGLFDEVMREIHTLKGESRMLGLLAVNRVAHRTEDLLLHARRTGAMKDAGLLEVAYAGLDLLGAYVAEPEAVISADDESRSVAFESRVASVLAGRGATTSPSVPAPTAAAGTTAPAVTPPLTEPAPASAPAPAGAKEGSGVVRVSGDVVDDLTRTAGVLGLLQARIERATKTATDLQARAREAVATLRRSGAPVAEPSVALAPVRDLTEALGEELHALGEACFTASLRQQRLRDAVSTLRLSAVAGLFGRFARTVRDIARELGKEARLETHGGEVGADQRILDALADPLLHLVRNAVDHGIEPPAMRESLGKPRTGTITLSAQQAGRFVEIRASDDGRGVDPRAVGAAAVRAGLLSEGDVARMTKDELYDQLFRPSFSTKGEVTDVSGRGVGLDVVKRVVEELGGGVRVVSEIGRGTDFLLRVPVSSALVDALVVEAGSSVLAVPAAYVERAMVVEPSAIEPTGHASSIRLPDGQRAVVVDLVALMGLAPSAGSDPAAPVRLVLVAEGGRTAALRVDRFVGEQSLVQETLDPFLRGLRGVTGTAMLEDGRLAPVLNVVQLFAWSREERAPAGSPVAAAAAAPTAVVAEDSELTRSLVAEALRRHGLAVVETVDGGEALERMRRSAPALLVTDLEMPGIDGIELIRRVRADPSLAHVPILVFTTRDQPDSKRQAAEAGADAYVVKREFEEEALRKIVSDLLASRRSTP